MASSGRAIISRSQRVGSGPHSRVRSVSAGSRKPLGSPLPVLASTLDFQLDHLQFGVEIRLGEQSPDTYPRIELVRWSIYVIDTVTFSVQ